jgi:imidazolonepropionase-like amidohydrolase/ABC-type multidrug transport system permease subunit
LRLTARDRLILFFNYLMPLVFFVGFGESFGARTSGGAFAQMLSMVLMFSILGAGFFGGGIRATADREAGILRRFKVAPITPGPILASSIITGWVLFMPSVLLFLALGQLRYGVALPERWLSLLVMISVGAIAFRAIGLIIAAVVNSMAESQILIQLLYLPMLMLSGATVPLHIMPDWLQTIAHFLPGTHLYMGIQNILVRNQNLAQNWQELGALLLAATLALIVASKLFRWEKEEKLKPSAKLWVAAALAPFLIAGAWQSWQGDNLRKTKILTREMQRAQTLLIRDARIFVGDGAVIEHGAVLVKNGRIEQVYKDTWPKPEDLRAEPVEAAGRTVMPALLDAGVNLAADPTMNVAEQPEKRKLQLERVLESYIYCGIAAVRDAPEPTGLVAVMSARVESGELTGPRIVLGEPSDNAISLTAAEVASGRGPFAADTLTQQLLRPRERAALASLTARQTARPELFAQAVSTFQMRRAAGLAMLPESHAGTALVPHGPALHHELQLWVRAGVSPRDALAAATSAAARALGLGDRMGYIRAGREATLILVDGNPLEDIAITSRISLVLNRGEHINRSEILEKSAKEDTK